MGWSSPPVIAKIRKMTGETIPGGTRLSSMPTLGGGGMGTGEDEGKFNPESYSCAQWRKGVNDGGRHARVEGLSSVHL